MSARGQWTGGASVPLRTFGMYNVSKLGATLTITPERVSMAVRPAFLTSRIASAPWGVRPGDQPAVFPVRGSAFARGVGFQIGSTRPFYFWCGRALPDVLAAIEAAGFPVEMVVRRPQYR